MYMGFISTKRINWAWRRYEFFGLIIYGPQGIGKTTYMLKVMYEIYKDWDKVLEHLVFSLDDLIDVMKRAREKRIKVIGWDDAGVHGHKYVYFLSKEYVMLLSAWVDVVRIRIAGWLITTPNPSQLLKPIRESPGFMHGKVVKVRGETCKNDLARIVKVYSRHWYPDGRIRYVKVYYDSFKARLPNDVYKQYMELREQFYEYAEKNLLRKIGETEKKLVKNMPVTSPPMKGKGDGHGT